jgi:hypothetical protein
LLVPAREQIQRVADAAASDAERVDCLLRHRMLTPPLDEAEGKPAPPMRQGDGSGNVGAGRNGRQ